MHKIENSCLINRIIKSCLCPALLHNDLWKCTVLKALLTIMCTYNIKN